jgi:hypothetical protein
MKAISAAHNDSNNAQFQEVRFCPSRSIPSWSFWHPQKQCTNPFEIAPTWEKNSQPEL